MARPLGMHARQGRAMKGEAVQTSSAHVQAQGASSVSAISISKVVSDGDGNTIVSGKAATSAGMMHDAMTTRA